MSAVSSPRVSILLPVRNAESTLAACLRSLQRQTASDWECIIIDDGSQDASLTYARWFAARDPRLVIISTPHQGLVTALNTGLQHCRGRFIARMDADDLMHRHRLASQLQMLDDYPNLAAVGAHVRIFPRRHLREGRRAYERWLNSIDTPRRVCEDAFVECPIAHPTLMIRHSVMRTQSYRDCGWPEDYDLILRLLAAQHTIGVEYPSASSVGETDRSVYPAPVLRMRLSVLPPAKRPFWRVHFWPAPITTFSGAMGKPAKHYAAHSCRMTSTQYTSSISIPAAWAKPSMRLRSFPRRCSCACHGIRS